MTQGLAHTVDGVGVEPSRSLILNGRQYRITKAWAARFRASGALPPPGGPNIDPLMGALCREAERSQADTLEREVKEYEALVKAGGDAVIQAASIREIGVALIKVRIASGLTQAALAKRLRCHANQVQREEDERYARCSLTRLAYVAERLGVRLAATVSLVPHPSPDPSNGLPPNPKGEKS